MDNQRLILIIALFLVGMMLWNQWQIDYGLPQSPINNPQSQTSHNANTDNTITNNHREELPVLPDEQLTPQGADAIVETVTDTSVQMIDVMTDVFNIKISTIGGDIRQANLLQYPIALNDSRPFPLMNEQRGKLFIAQSGLLNENRLAPNHKSQFTSKQSSYHLDDNQEQLTVELYWQQQDIQITRTYTFKRGSYDIELVDTVSNHSEEVWKGSQYTQLQRQDPHHGKRYGMVYTYTGGVIYSPQDKYQKIPFSDMEENALKRTINHGWLAIIEHYFIASWVPPKAQDYQYYSKVLSENRYVLGSVSPQIEVPAKQQAQFKSTLYIGPKIQDELAKLATGLELTVDYGYLTVIAQPIFWLLKWFHQWLGNWGWAIIMVTVLIKLVFYKLSETSFRSMANMRKLHPKLQSLKERYGDDRQRMNQAMMELYKKEKINPLGGCLPILVQIPVFISLYWVLLESVELRQAPFILWIEDLSIKDPYFVLPLIMGASMLVQQHLNPAPLDPIQKKVMMMMPIVFTVMFAFFPSGLVLYWVVNNILSIAQQWLITKRVEEGAK